MNGRDNPKKAGGGTGSGRGAGHGGHSHGGHGHGKHGGKRPVGREHPRGEAKLDRERAVAELKRFLDLAVREMGLAVESEITTARARVAAPDAVNARAATERDPDAQPTEEQLDALGELDAQPMDLDRQPGNTIEEPEQPEISIMFRGEDADLLLERNAELLLALEHVAHRWLRLDPRLHDQVRFDCGDYRTMRLDELKLSARVAAQRVRETGEPFRFNPMSPRERRLIHLELTGAQGVRTASEGIGDRRQLVIYPTTRGKPLPQR